MRPSILAQRLPNGDWHEQVIPYSTTGDRPAVRHQWAAMLEAGFRSTDWDHTPHPYTNWGYANSLEYTLSSVEGAP